MRRLILACALLCTLAAARASGQIPLAQGRAVLVIVGVAGDMESDKAYSDSLDRLLDGLGKPGSAPKSLTLLVENPAALTRRFPFPAKVLTNRRETIASLAGSVPDLVIVWGHGGMQGSQPVLHVPGPRLMPADLLALNGTGSSKPSDWVLYFKNSQAFAQVLSAPDRRVLASEGEKTFTFDPIGLPLLLAALPGAPDLPALAGRTGKAVTAWYATRNQAPTEAPTLWTDGHPLAASAENAAATAPTTPGTDAWRGPSSVDPAAYPDADAVVLRETVQAVIGDNPQLSREEDRYVQILTSEGKRFADLDLAFSPPEENLTILACEVRQPDGTVEIVDTGTDDEGAPPGGPPEEYPAARRKFFSVPNIVPGAVLHLRQRHEWKHFPLPKVYLALPLSDDLPILDKSLEIRVPGGLPFHFAWKNPPPGTVTDPKVESNAYGSVYRWHAGPLAALPVEPLQPHDREPTLLASTFGDWGEFLAWYQGITRETTRATPEMAEKARELTRDCHGDLEKIRTLFRYVTELRYVAVPLGVNAYRPHAAANVFHHRYGDCKDKANLLNTLLASQGFDARLVLAPRFAVALPDVPGAAFNHAISHVSLQGKSLWLDTTDDICRFGLLPPGDPGRRVLLIADREKELRTLPLPQPSDSRLELTSSLTLAGSDAIEGKSECRATGIMDYQMRAAARRSGGAKNDHLNLLLGLARPLTGAETLRRQDFLSPAEMSQDFTWQGESSWDGLVSPLPAGNGKFVRVPFLLPTEWPVASQPRTTGLYLNQGYPCEIVQRTTLRMPATATSRLPTGGENADGPLKYQLRWAQTDATTVTATLTLTLAKADLSVEEALAFQRSLRALHQTLAQGVLLTGESAPVRP